MAFQDGRLTRFVTIVTENFNLGSYLNMKRIEEINTRSNELPLFSVQKSSTFDTGNFTGSKAFWHRVAPHAGLKASGVRGSFVGHCLQTPVTLSDKKT